MEFSDRLKELRNKNELNQTQLAAMLNLKPSAISKYENQMTQPDIGMLIRISEIFNVSMDYLVGKSSVANPYTTDKITPTEFELVVRFRRLSAENKIRIDERVNSLLEHQGKEKK